MYVNLFLPSLYSWMSDFRYEPGVAFGEGGVGERAEIVYHLGYEKGKPILFSLVSIVYGG
jgi:hypothetical protein